MVLLYLSFQILDLQSLPASKSVTFGVLEEIGFAGWFWSQTVRRSRKKSCEWGLNWGDILQEAVLYPALETGVRTHPGEGLTVRIVGAELSTVRPAGYLFDLSNITAGDIDVGELTAMA